ncbi:hypothetical protein ACFV6F_17975 [Kitasatospora phosalacinea]|uniref:hypothetical protein n=1 Tax=Kitasatospora phosalacinea TaxID=2065 RepID=UPI0036503A5F
MGIKGFDRAPLVGPDALRAAHGERLAALVATDRRDAVAVEFAFTGPAGGHRLRIVNGLDENRLERGPADPQYVRHHL